MSWLHKPGGYHLLCNRDEKRTRGAAEPPRWVEGGGARYLAPTDRDSGGTWIAVNDYGLALCLLNGPPGHAERSRGLVIPELVRARSADDCSLLFSRVDLTPFAPFTLLMLDPDRPARVARWDGSRASVAGNARAPITSSSFDPESVRRERLDEFARLAPSDPVALFRFHASHAGSTGAHAPCMHRPDAETVSFTWITVTQNDLLFRYFPAAPCALALNSRTPWNNSSPSRSRPSRAKT